MGSLGIVIPAFNAGNLLSLAADSARVALGGTDDIVIVDDGSTKKGSLRILAGLEAQGYRVLRQDNRGVSAARNAGIRALRTPYVIALDSDDMITSDAVRLAGEILEQSPEVSIVAGSGVQIDEQGGTHCAQRSEARVTRGHVVVHVAADGFSLPTRGLGACRRLPRRRVHWGGLGLLDAPAARGRSGGRAARGVRGEARGPATGHEGPLHRPADDDGGGRPGASGES